MVISSGASVGEKETRCASTQGSQSGWMSGWDSEVVPMKWAGEGKDLGERGRVIWGERVERMVVQAVRKREVAVVFQVDIVVVVGLVALVVVEEDDIEGDTGRV